MYLDLFKLVIQG